MRIIAILPMSRQTSAAQINFDHPDALETDLLVQHLQVHYPAGETVLIPTYDFTTHSRSNRTLELCPRPIIIVEGILLLVEQMLRDALNLKIFVDTPPDIPLDSSRQPRC